MAVIHGRNLIVRMNSTAIAGSRSCSLTTKSDLLEVSSPQDGKYRHFIGGRQEWSVKCSYLVIDDSYINFPMIVGQSVMLEFVDRNGRGLIGTAIVEQCEVSSSIGNLAQGNFTFRGNGEFSAKYNLLPSLTSGWEGESGGTVEYNASDYGIRSVGESDLYTPALYRYRGDHLCFSLDGSAQFIDVTFCYINNHNWTDLSDIYDNGQTVNKTLQSTVVGGESRDYASFIMPEDGYMTVYIPSSNSWIYKPMLEIGDTPSAFQAP